MNKPITLLKTQKKNNSKKKKHVRKSQQRLQILSRVINLSVIKNFANSMFLLHFYQIACIDKLIVFSSISLLFPIALEQNLTVSQESLLIFWIPNESTSELKINM